ncbi:primosomal protein N' [Patescibacteria group bacterium]|jgi:primosomal protein N'|nr:primosomal protein N' [Patescibacteria group bacterium]
MYVVRVVPITRGAFAEELTYFGKHAPRAGSIIRVPLQRRVISAIVLHTSPLRDAKAQVRTADFALRRIEASEESLALTPPFLRALSRAADYYLTTTGTLLFHALPSAVRAADTLSPVTLPEPAATSTPGSKQLLMAAEERRTEEYVKLIRAAFARGRSVFLLTPTIHDAELLARALKKGIEDYRFLFHSNRSKKQLLTSWQEATHETHPILAIMTPGFLALPRADLGLIIIDREATRSYKQLQRPFADSRQIAEWLAEELGADLVLADEPVRVATMQRYQAGELEALRDIPTRITRTPPTTITDMRAPAPESREARTPFSVFSAELAHELSGVVERGEQAFLFVARRGIAPVTVCSDCGERVSCLSCGAPVVLHQGARENVFVCHACGALRSASECCRACTSWKLTTLGIGIQLVERELARTFPEAPRLVFDREHVSTHAKAERFMRTFSDTPGCILLGTEMALTYLPRVALSGIVSLDSLLSVPEWNMYERIFSIVTRTQERTERACLIQTRKPEEPVLQSAKRGALGDFFREELADRKQWGYPPFSTLIKVTTEGSAEETRQEMQALSEALAPWGFAAMPQALATPRGTTRRHGFLRLPKGRAGPPRRRRSDPEPPEHPAWPIPELAATLRSFGSSITVEVDPDKIL